MIIYVASYPRSGNFWMQTLLGNQFMRPTTNIHVAIENEDVSRQRSIRTIKKLFDIDMFELSELQLQKYPAELSGWLLGYQVPGTSGISCFLTHGCKEIVQKDEIRRALAEDDQYYFLKTHFQPHAQYLPGEYVVMLVRNPGAAIWSYYNFKRDIKKFQEQGLSTIIQEDQYGNWSEYHQKWLVAAEKLNPRFFLAKYEELGAGELDFCDKLSAFINLPVISRELRPFDYYHQLRPSLTRQGKATGWEENYSKKQLKLLWELHGELMSYFGYPEPNYKIGLDQDKY